MMPATSRPPSDRALVSGEGRAVARATTRREPPTPTRRALRREQAKGLMLVVLFVFGLGGWAAIADLEGAVVANGLVVVDSEVKLVQHPNGGVIGEVAVVDGQRVAEGDLIVRLDETVERANLALVQKQLDEAVGMRSRLEAERDGRPEITFPDVFLARAGDPVVARIVAEEQRLFQSRIKGREGQKAQFRERIAQLKEQIAGTDGQQRAKRKELGYIAEEKVGVQELVTKKLLPVTRLSALNRDEARLLGEAEQLHSASAQSKGRIAETELQILQLDQDARTEVLRDLREVQGKIGDLEERLIAARDRIRRIDVRAPQAGIVHQLAVHTVGGVIGPRDVIAQIVPVDQTLAVEAKVSPRQIDQVFIGQNAFLRLTALNQRTTPELHGLVTRVGANVVQEKDGVQDFLIRASLPEDQLARIGGAKVVPGMPVEVHMRTESRSALSYLLKPLIDSFHRIGRER
jgi:HlyD family secretion protein